MQCSPFQAKVSAGNPNPGGTSMSGMPETRYARSGDNYVAYQVMGEGPLVLVSRTVSDLVAGSGLRFEERGTHSLKGVPGSWQLLAAT
jgi:hypothetical protein